MVGLPITELLLQGWQRNSIELFWNDAIIFRWNSFNKTSILFSFFQNWCFILKLRNFPRVLSYPESSRRVEYAPCSCNWWLNAFCILTMYYNFHEEKKKKVFLYCIYFMDLLCMLIFNYSDVWNLFYIFFLFCKVDYL